MMRMLITLFAFLLFTINGQLTSLLPGNRSTRRNSRFNSRLSTAIERVYQEPFSENTLDDYLTSRKVSLFYVFDESN